MNAYGGADDLRQIAELIGAPVCGDLFASHSPLTFPTFHPQYSGFFAEDERSPKGFDVFWSAGGTMFTAAGETDGADCPARREGDSHHRRHGRARAHVSGRRADDGANRSVGDTRCSRSCAAARCRRHAYRRPPARGRARRGGAAARARRSRRDGSGTTRRSRSNAFDRVEPADRSGCDRRDRVDQRRASRRCVFRSESRRRTAAATSRPPAAVSAGACRTRLAPKIAQPHRQVVALVGDGSFQFGVQALWTACATKCRSPS